MAFNAIAGLAAIQGFRDAQQYQSDIAARKARNQYVVDTTPGLAMLSNARTDSELGDLGDKEELRPLRQENNRISAELDGEKGRLGLSQVRAAVSRNPVVEQTNDVNAGLTLAQAQSNAANRPIQDQIDASKARAGLTVQQGLEQVAPLNNTANLGKAAAGASAGGIQALQSVVQALNTGDSTLLGRSVADAHSALTGKPLHEDVAGARMIDVNGQKALAVVDSSGQIIADIPPMPASTLTQLQQQINLGKKSDLKSVAPGATLVRTGPDGVPRPVFTAPESPRSMRSTTGPLQRDAEYLAQTLGIPLPKAIEQIQQGKVLSRTDFIQRNLADRAKADLTGRFKPTEADVAAASALYDQIQSAGGGRAQQAAQPAATSGTSNTSQPTMAPTNADLRRLMGLPQ
ncbi:hypothetical protein HNP33_003044 [Comamonas odontotermitis]|uniref:Uncharacterized protein n=1 Tax=Comamonas odontotermitis TaxID=379895 RepID=A0ABR6RIF4_9BURK|nr:hypothetical protein [Comamonas odontotermitis]MBB6578939.1 hypothetical protein [Comamonas odontotermitis]